MTETNRLFCATKSTSIEPACPAAPRGAAGHGIFLPLNKDDDQFDELTSGAAKLFGVTVVRISKLRVRLRETREAFRGDGSRLMRYEKARRKLAVIGDELRPAPPARADTDTSSPQPIRRLLGITQDEFRDVIAGRKDLNGNSGPEGINEALKRINVDHEIDRARMVCTVSCTWTTPIWSRTSATFWPPTA